MDNLNTIIFGKKKFSELLSEIYENQKKKSTQISSLINELKPLITDTGDASLIVPLIKEYLDIGVKNDEQLIKLSTVIQRILQNNTTEEGGFIITDDERRQILNEVDKLSKE